MPSNLLMSIYKDKRSVFSFKEIALLVQEPIVDKLKQRVSYYVRQGKLRRLRRGIYAKDTYEKEELASKLFTPCYISLEYVLQKSGIIFQYDSRLTSVSYLSRAVTIDDTVYHFRKIKNDILVDTQGIVMHQHGTSIATPERAFLDLLYLNQTFYPDNISGLDLAKIEKLKHLYQSKRLLDQLNKIL